MGRRRWNKRNPEKLAALKERAKDVEQGDPAVRLLAVHPTRSLAAVAMGTSVRIADYSSGAQFVLPPAPLQLPQQQQQPQGKKQQQQKQEEQQAEDTAAAGTSGQDGAAAATSQASADAHTCTLRALQFSPDGKLLLTASDDKAARIWCTDSWRCLAAWRLPKKPSAGAFTPDSAYVLVADKFGEVNIGDARAAASAASTSKDAASAALLVPHDPARLLGHFCSIITDIAVSPCGRFVVTTDKDYKVRVSLLRERPMLGSCEVQCYCMGHQEFASCAAYASRPAAAAAAASLPAASSPAGGPQALLLSGSGDGTVRLWEPLEGGQLAVFVASAPEQLDAAAAGANGGVGDAPVSTAACTSGQDGAGADVGDGAAAGEAAPGEAEDDEGAGSDGPGAMDVDGEEGEGDGAGEEGQGEGEGDDGADAGGQDAGGHGDNGGSGEPQRRSQGPQCAPVLSVAVSPDGCTTAVVVADDDDEVQLLSVDWEAQPQPALELRQRLRFPDLRHPCKASFDAQGRLWVVGGVPLPGAKSAHVAVAQQGADGSFAACTEQVLHADSRSVLEARVAEEEAKMAEGGELLVGQYVSHLRKRKYSEQELEERKRRRTDWKESQRLALLVQHKQQQRPSAAGSQVATFELCSAASAALLCTQP